MSLTRGLVGEPRNSVPESDGDMKKEDLNTLGLADYPAFHLELKTTWGEPDNESSCQLTLKPSYLHYAQSSARRKGSGHKSVTVAFTINAEQPSGKDELETNATAVFRHKFGRLKIGNYFDEKQLKGTKAAQIIPKSYGPMMSGLIIESEDQDIALQALLTAYESNQDDLSKVLKMVIVGTTDQDKDN